MRASFQTYLFESEVLYTLTLAESVYRFNVSSFYGTLCVYFVYFEELINCAQSMYRRNKECFDITFQMIIFTTTNRISTCIHYSSSLV